MRLRFVVPSRLGRRCPALLASPRRLLSSRDPVPGPSPFAPPTPVDSAVAAPPEEVTDGAPATGVFPGVRPHADGNFVAVYTCKVCETRSARLISKRAYSHGIVLLRCPGCDNLHLLADHIGMFGGRVSAQELLAAHGEAVRRGTVAAGEDGQVVGLEPQDLEAIRDAAAGIGVEQPQPE